MNLNKIQEWVKTGTGLVAIITAALTLISWVNHSYIDYLESHFATKSDLARIERKLDRVLEKRK